MNNRKKIHAMSLASILTALIVLMTFTPIGYIKTGGLEITLLVVPVVIGAILLGPLGGAYLGLVFGLTSFLQCVSGLSVFGATLLSINPFFCFLVCVPTRTLMGFLVGVIFKALLKVFKHDIFAHIIASVSGALLNTLFFMTVLILCFYNTSYIQGFVDFLNVTNPFTFVILFVGINGLVEALINFVIGAFVSKTIFTIYKKRNPSYYEEKEKVKVKARRHLIKNNKKRVL